MWISFHSDSILWKNAPKVFAGYSSRITIFMAFNHTKSVFKMKLRGLNSVSKLNNGNIANYYPLKNLVTKAAFSTHLNQQD